MTEENRPSPNPREKPRFNIPPEDLKPFTCLASPGAKDSFEEFPFLRPREFTLFMHEDFPSHRYPIYPPLSPEDLPEQYLRFRYFTTDKDKQIPEQALPALLYFLGYMGILVVIIVILFLATAYLIM